MFWHTATPVSTPSFMLFSVHLSRCHHLLLLAPIFILSSALTAVLIFFCLAPTGTAASARSRVKTLQCVIHQPGLKYADWKYNHNTAHDLTAALASVSNLALVPNTVSASALNISPCPAAVFIYV